MNTEKTAAAAGYKGLPITAHTIEQFQRFPVIPQDAPALSRTDIESLSSKSHKISIKLAEGEGAKTMIRAASFMFDAWMTVAIEVTQRVYDYYSKAWHRKYGAKENIIQKTVVFMRPHGSGYRIIEVELDSFSGDWLARAVTSAGISAPAKATQPNLAVRLNKAYTAKKLSQKRGFTVYSRQLLGVHVDYCIQAPNKATYHDNDRKALIKGLQKKVLQQAAKKHPVLPDAEPLITEALCRNLGFCKAGIQECAELIGLSVTGAYSAKEVQHAVAKAGYAAEQFRWELNALSAFLGKREDFFLHAELLHAA